MKTWQHSNLGEFIFRESSWVHGFRLPAFDVFDRGGAPANLDRERLIDLAFEADDEEHFPAEDEVSVARATLENHERLISEGITMLFEDLLGEGPDSGMWWHGSIEQVREIIASSLGSNSQGLPAVATDLHQLMSQPSIFVQEFGYDYDEPCAILSFEAVFEAEHGIGILTDGQRVLGTGYQMDVSPN